MFSIKDLECVGIVGLGLLGGSVGLALYRSLPDVRRVGYSHRPSTRRKALEAGVVDEAAGSLGQLFERAQLTILATPIGVFPEMLQKLAGVLSPGSLVTDVGSTKVLPVRWGRKLLPRSVEFIGSHPIAGSEQQGVGFSRADLFDQANCIMTPTAANSGWAIKLVEQFWQALGMSISRMSPAQHDKLLARVSHLPHLVATALVNSVTLGDARYCGKGFLDTTRIASGPAGVWRDILMTNADQTDRSITSLIRELTRMQKALRSGKGKQIEQMLDKARTQRNHLVNMKLQRKELPA